MRDIILVHGAWHGGWCWSKLTPLLEAKGYNVAAMTLPGHEEPMGPAATTGLETYADAVLARILAAKSPPLVVGHSMGGAVITQAAAKKPLIAGLLYVASFPIKHGESLSGVAEGTESQLGEAMEFIEDGAKVRIRPEMAGPVFYHDCSEADQKEAATFLVPQPMKPLTDELSDPDNNAGSYRRFGILCTEDRAVDPALQRKLYEEAGLEETWVMATSHSPFLSAPDKVADVIDEIGKRLGDVEN